MDELEISGKRYISTKRAGKEHGYHSDYIGQLIRGKKVLGQKVGRAWYVEEVSLADYLGKEAPKGVVQKVAKPVVEESSPDALVGGPTSHVGLEDVVELVPQEKTEEPTPLIEEKIDEVVEQKIEEAIEEEEIIVPEIKEVKHEPVVVAERSPDATVGGPTSDVGQKIEIKEYQPEPVVERSIEKKIETADGYRVAIHTPAPTLGGLKYVEDTEPLLPQTGEHAVTTRMHKSDTEDKEEAEETETFTPRKKFSMAGASFVVVFGLILFAATAAACTYTAAKLVLKEGQTATINYTLEY